MKNDKQRNLTPVEDLIAEDFGQDGSLERDAFEMECDAFIIGEQLKEERRKAGLTQESKGYFFRLFFCEAYVSSGISLLSDLALSS